MALATRPKPKTHHKKRQALHHRKSKHYIKTYYPYLPLFAIVGLGFLVGRLWPTPAHLNIGASPDIAATRLGALTGSTSNSLLYVVMAATVLAFAAFVLTHWYRVQRMLNRGEKFMVDHPWFDVALALIITAGVVLTRASY